MKKLARRDILSLLAMAPVGLPIAVKASRQRFASGGVAGSRCIGLADLLAERGVVFDPPPVLPLDAIVPTKTVTIHVRAKTDAVLRELKEARDLISSIRTHDPVAEQMHDHGLFDFDEVAA